jgi:putative acetyltransferase
MLIPKPATLSLYKNAGFPITHEGQAETASNKTIGGGIRRYYFTKAL